MDVGTAKKLLRDNGIAIIGESRLGNETGTQIRLGGAVVNVFDNGNWNVQGGNRELVDKVDAILRQAEPTATCSNPSNASPAILSHAEPTSKSPASNKIFVVYGHDENVKRDTENLLRRWGLEPLFLDQLPSSGDTIIESLERYTGEAEYAIVLATPDDEGHRACHPKEKSFRARQNVVLELGMVLARLGRKRVAILIKKSDKMENPSDIGGLIYIEFEDKIEEGEATIKLLRELVKAGYDIPANRL